MNFTAALRKPFSKQPECADEETRPDLTEENYKLRKSIDRLNQKSDELVKLNIEAQEYIIGLQKQLTRAENCNLEFQAIFKNHMDIESTEDEVTALRTLIADDLQNELDKAIKALNDAQDVIKNKDKEIELLREETPSSVYCERLGYYCTPYNQLEWR